MTETRPTLKDSIQKLVVLPLYERWAPEMFAKVAEHAAMRATTPPQEIPADLLAAYRWSRTIWVRVRGDKLYSSYHDADADAAPVSIVDAFRPIEGMRFEDGEGNGFVVAGGDVLHGGKAVMGCADLLQGLVGVSAPDAWVTEMP